MLETQRQLHHQLTARWDARTLHTHISVPLQKFLFTSSHHTSSTVTDMSIMGSDTMSLNLRLALRSHTRLATFVFVTSVNSIYAFRHVPITICRQQHLCFAVCMSTKSDDSHYHYKLKSAAGSGSRVAAHSSRSQISPFMWRELKMFTDKMMVEDLVSKQDAKAPIWQYFTLTLIAYGDSVIDNGGRRSWLPEKLKVAVCRLQLFIWQLTPAAPSCSIPSCNISN